MKCKIKGDRQHQVLVVEDDKNTADALKLLLENRGHEVTIASDGDQAIERGKC